MHVPDAHMQPHLGVLAALEVEEQCRLRLKQPRIHQAGYGLHTHSVAGLCMGPGGAEEGGRWVGGRAAVSEGQESKAGGGM